LTTYTIVLKLSGRLPDNMSVEYYIAAGYLLNRIPTRRIRYKTLIGGFLEEILIRSRIGFRSEHLGAEHIYIIIQGISLISSTLKYISAG
jgi:hypothetical protein